MKTRYLEFLSEGLIPRTFSTLLRAIIPFVIIFISSADQLGIYYLATSILFFLSSIIGVDLGFYYSREYLKDINSKTSTYNRFNKQFLRLNFLVFFISFIFYIFLSNNIPSFFFLIPNLITLEAASLELGKFYRNVGLVNYASSRELYRAIFFAGSIILSLYYFEEILTFYSLGIYMLGLIFLLNYEILKFGNLDVSLIKNFFPKISSLQNGFIKLFRISAPQFIQNQVNGFILVIERIFLTSLMGLSFQGLFSLLWSLVSVSSSILFFSFIARTLKNIISNLDFPKKETYREAKNLFYNITAIVFFISITVLFLKPILNWAFELDLKNSYFFIITAIFFSVISNSFISPVGPLFGSWERIWLANSYTLLILLPYLFLILFKEFFQNSIFVTLTTIIFCSSLQIFIRMHFFNKQTKLKNLK